jgi:hypothetical protein
LTETRDSGLDSLNSQIAQVETRFNALETGVQALATVVSSEDSTLPFAAYRQYRSQLGVLAKKERLRCHALGLAWRVEAVDICAGSAQAPSPGLAGARRRTVSLPVAEDAALSRRDDAGRVRHSLAI